MADIIKFRKEDIKDQHALAQMVQEETKRIYESPRARKGRAWSVIEKMVWQGKPAEMWLIENLGYTPAPPTVNSKGEHTYYHDLIDPNGVDITEVKAWTEDHINRGIETTVRKILSGTWNMSTQVVVFAFEPQDHTYTYIDKIQIR